MSDAWIGKVYGATTQAELRDLYHQWAHDYDATMVQTGYLHIPVIIGLVSRYIKRTDSGILDAGVGTGAVGGVLSLLGYNNLHGLDMTEAMLAKARERQCYVDLRHGVLGETLDYVDAGFDAVISTGTFTYGHAPPAAFRELTRILEPGGFLMFTCGTIVWDEGGFQLALDDLVARGLLQSVETTPIYRPMPFSPSEREFTARAHVYRRSG